MRGATTHNSNLPRFHHVGIVNNSAGSLDGVFHRSSGMPTADNAHYVALLSLLALNGRQFSVIAISDTNYGFSVVV